MLIPTIAVPTFAQLFPNWSSAAHKLALQAVQPDIRIAADAVRRRDGPPPPLPPITGRFPQLPLPTADRRIQYADEANKATVHTRYSLMVPMAYDSLFKVHEAITPWLAAPELGDWRSWKMKQVKHELTTLQRLILCELTIAGHCLKVEIDDHAQLMKFAWRWNEEFEEMRGEVAWKAPKWGPEKRYDVRLIRFWHIQLLDVALQINLRPLLALVDQILMKFPLTLDAEASTTQVQLTGQEAAE